MLTKVNRCRSLLRSRRGFTLLEIIIVMGFISIFLAMVIPNFNRAIPEMKIDRAARKLATDLRLSQQKAVAEMTDVLVRLEQAENRYYVYYIGREAVWYFLEDPLKNNATLLVDFDEIDTFRGTQLLNDTWIWFTPLGDLRQPVTDYTITLTNSDIGYSRQVRITYPLGKVEILP